MKKEIPIQSSYFKYLKIIWTPVSTGVTTFYEITKIDGLVKSQKYPLSLDGRGSG